MSLILCVLKLCLFCFFKASKGILTPTCFLDNQQWDPLFSFSSTFCFVISANVGRYTHGWASRPNPGSTVIQVTLRTVILPSWHLRDMDLRNSLCSSSFLECLENSVDLICCFFWESDAHLLLFTLWGTWSSCLGALRIIYCEKLIVSQGFTYLLGLFNTWNQVCLCFWEFSVAYSFQHGLWSVVFFFCFADSSYTSAGYSLTLISAIFSPALSLFSVYNFHFLLIFLHF